jgi:hypothetical protein
VLACGSLALTMRSAGTPRVRTTLAVAQLGLGGLYAVVLLLYGVSRIRLGIGHYQLTHDMHDPKDLVPFGSSALNPFSWLFVPAELYVLLGGWTIGGVLAPASVVHALTGSSRRRWLAATAAAVSVAGSVQDPDV